METLQLNNHCVICGMARNCGQYLPQVLNNMEIMGQTLFGEKQYKIIIVYDKSWDNTLDILKSYANSHADNFILYINDAQLSKVRTINIAQARNICLHMLRKAFRNWEYFIMMDCDDICCGSMDLEPLAYNLKDENKMRWDGLTFNRNPYYDTWALSIYPYVGSKEHFKDGHDIWLNYINSLFEKIRQGNYNQKDLLIGAYSAFNGLAIYKMDKYVDSHYDGHFRIDYIPTNLLHKTIEMAGPISSNYSSEPGDCEHRFFHINAYLKYGAMLKISPQIVLL